jgi:arsenite methyltransferase
MRLQLVATAAVGAGLYAVYTYRRHMAAEAHRTAIREAYAATARGDQSCCVSTGGAAALIATGYSDADRALAKRLDVDMGVGCGNPVELAVLVEGETVVDLGSGAGLDCLIAAQRVGPKGRSIGIDMTPEMLDKARAAAQQAGIVNADFAKGGETTGIRTHAVAAV